MINQNERDKKRWNLLRVSIMFCAMLIFINPAYSACSNCWEEPNPDYDPTNPYESDRECIDKTTVPCTASDPPPTGQGERTFTSRPVGPREILDPSLGSYAFTRLSGTETYESVEQFTIGSGPVEIHGNCEYPLMDSHTIGSITIPLTIELSVGATIKKFITIEAATSYTWNFRFGGSPYQLYMGAEDCTHHCASRWIINKKVCASMKGEYREEAFLGPDNRLYSHDTSVGPTVKCTADKEDKVEWVTNSTFCRP